jgi:predicted transcriptional regulator
MDQQDFDLVTLTGEVVAAYVENNRVDTADLPALIETVHAALLMRTTKPIEAERAQQLVPAVSIKKSVTTDYIVCLEDGKKFKSLKRHLRTQYDLTPDEYRAKWRLPADYPMVAPSYAAARSQLARAIGLGRKPKTTATAKAKPAESRAAPKRGKRRRASAA